MSRVGLYVQAVIVGVTLAVVYAFGHSISTVVVYLVIALPVMLLSRWGLRPPASEGGRDDAIAWVVRQRRQAVRSGLWLIAAVPLAVCAYDLASAAVPWSPLHIGLAFDPMSFPLTWSELPDLPIDDGGTIDNTKEQFVHAMAVILAVGFGTVYVSTVVDWCYVQPRVCGQLGGAMPCQASLMPEWKPLTRWWLLHRLTAMLAFVGSIAACVTLAAIQWLGFSDVLAAVVGAAATLFAGYYLRRAAIVIAFSLAPPMHVGDKVILADEPEHSPYPRAWYYVVDVAVEGVRLMQLDERDRVDMAGNVRTHDRLLDIEQAFSLMRARRRYLGCHAGSCTRTNPYCPRARAQLDG